MAKFKYSAIDPEGNQKTGRVTAGSEEEAQEKLETQGYFIQELAVETRGAKASRTKDIQRRSQEFAEDAGEKVGKKKKKPLSFGKAVNKEGLTTFTRQMATLLNAGLPLLRSLEVMVRQQKNPAFKEILESLAENVRSGNSFSDGLEMHPKLFDNLYVNMVRAGEAGGVLEVVLDRLASFMEKAEKTRKKVQSAMVYPIVVIFVAVLVVTVLMVFVVPQFQSMFEDMAEDGGRGMPLPTQIIINISDAIKMVFTNFLAALGTAGVVTGSIIGYRLFAASEAGKSFLHLIAMNLPKIGSMIQLVSMGRFTRTFGTLMDSGVPILQAMTISSDIINNVHYRKALGRVHDSVRDGESVTAPMQRETIFPVMLASMVEVGEETGQLPEMLNQIADNYDEDIDNAVSAITSIIEPVLIVFLAVVVGFIVIALFLPIIGIMQNMGG
jgi:type IV pilus assembly protein PilC